MGVFGSADAGPAGPASSAGGSAPTCSRFWNPGPVLRSIPLSARPSRRCSRRPLGAWPDCRPCAGWSPPKLIGGLSLTAMGTASGGYWQVAGIGEALGWAPLHRGRAVERRSRDAAARAGAPAQGRGHRRVARFVRRARFEGVGRRKRPLAARCSRGVFPNGTLRGFSDA